MWGRGKAPTQKKKVVWLRETMAGADQFRGANFYVMLYCHSYQYENFNYVDIDCINI